MLAGAIRQEKKRNISKSKGKSKVIFACRWHDYMHRKPNDSTKMLELINKFIKVVGYKIDIKSVVSLYS